MYYNFVLTRLIQTTEFAHHYESNNYTVNCNFIQCVIVLVADILNFPT